MLRYLFLKAITRDWTTCFVLHIGSNASQESSGKDNDALGWVLGYLDINGAGKTTALKILSGDIIRTSGKATLAG